MYLYKIILYFTLFSILLSCKPTKKTIELPISAIYHDLQLTATDTISVVGGGFTTQTYPLVEFNKTKLDTLSDNIVALTFDTTEASLCFFPFKYLPDSATNYQLITCTFNNPSNDSVSILARISGNRSATEHIWAIGKGKNAFTFDLSELYLHNKPFTQNPRFRFGFTLKSAGPALLQVLPIKFTVAPKSNIALLDAFGQRKNKNWLNKITNPQQLTDQYKTEFSKLPPIQAQKNFSKFITIDSAGGQWRFVLPSGKKFWSLGVNGVRLQFNKQACTPFKNREWIFDELPAHNSKLGKSYFEEKYIALYYLNVLHKYPSEADWATKTIDRLNHWGFNTIGNWSDTLLTPNNKMPFTFTLQTTDAPGSELGIPDVFDPKWAVYVDSVFAVKTKKVLNSELLLGYFIDNEAHFKTTGFFFHLNPNSFSKEIFLNQLIRKYNSIENYNKINRTTFTHFKQLLNTDWAVTSANQADDLKIFHRQYLEKYYSTIRKSLKQHDPNHLYLGNRFTRTLPTIKYKEGNQNVVDTLFYVLQIYGRYTDVTSINVYSPVPKKAEMDIWHHYTQKPMLIGEFHIPVMSDKCLLPNYQAFPERERNQMVLRYLETWYGFNYALGCHWYQWVDQPFSGRGTDGENQAVGLVDITDQPTNSIINVFKSFSQTIE